MRNLTKKDIHKRFSGIIGDIKVSGRIQYQDEQFFLCQDSIDGCRCKNTLGYRFSWNVSSGTVDQLKRNNIKSLSVFSTKEEIAAYKDFSYGDLLTHPSIKEEKRLVEGIIGKVLVLTNPSGEVYWATNDNLYKEGWRIAEIDEVEITEVIEMSVAEIAEKLDIDPKSLKIVDK